MAGAPAQPLGPISPDTPNLEAWGIGAIEQLVEPDEAPSILIVESHEINRRLMRGILRGEGYRILEAERPGEALEMLRREEIDLVILELMMPEMSGPDFCRRLKADRRTRLIPLLILTSIQGVENEIAGMDSGADEFLVKPLHPDLVRARVKAMLRHKAAVDSLEESESILFALAQAVEQRDAATIGHCERLATLSMTLGSALGLPRSQIIALYRGGYLHDIGKIAIPDAILFKNGPLSAAEWEIMKTHTLRGEEICRRTRTLKAVLPIIRHHHERWDGSGYPDGLRGEEIPLLARVLQVADIYDALTSERSYKPALPSSEAHEILEAEARRGWRDAKLVALLRKLSEMPLDQAAASSLVPWPTPEPMLRSLEAMRLALLEQSTAR